MCAMACVLDPISDSAAWRGAGGEPPTFGELAALADAAAELPIRSPLSGAVEAGVAAGEVHHSQPAPV